MKNKVSEYHTATFYLCSVFAIFVGLGIETCTTIPLTSNGGIGYYVSFVTIVGLSTVFFKYKDFQPNKVISIELISMNSKTHP